MSAGQTSNTHLRLRPWKFFVLVVQKRDFKDVGLDVCTSAYR